jgi:hypothetical protein
MQKYQDTILSKSGDYLPGLSVSVQTYPAGATATIYSDNGVTLATNPLTTDSLGRFSFYAADGRYQLVISGTGVTSQTISDILLEDPADATALSATSLSVAGDITFTGTGRRITGDFSNSTAANRVVLQSSTTNGITVLEAAPNGSGANSQVIVGNSGDIANTAGVQLLANATEARIAQFNRGSASSLPLTFRVAGSERARIDTSGNFLIGYTSSNGSYLLQVNSQIFATSSTIATSDGRYKENITPLSGALSLVKQLNPVSFNWKSHPTHKFDTQNKTVGFIAQEVKQILADQPYLNSIVKKNECVVQEEVKDDDGNVTTPEAREEFLGIAEGNLIALLTKAVQEQQVTIESLVQRVLALEAQA